MELDPSYIDDEFPSLNVKQLMSLVATAHLMLHVLRMDPDVVETGLNWAVKWHEHFSEEMALPYVPTQAYIKQKLRAALDTSSQDMKAAISNESERSIMIAGVAKKMFFLTFGKQTNEYLHLFYSDDETFQN